LQCTDLFTVVTTKNQSGPLYPPHYARNTTASGPSAF